LFFNVLPRVFWTVLVMYPGATVLLGKFLSDQRSRSRHLNELQQSREALKTTLYSIGDAVVATDAAGRVQQMNEVAEQLTGWPEPEALGKRLDEVLTIVDEETGQPMESPVAKVLRLGRKVDLADNALLVSRGQERRPIADSAAPIRDAAGQMTGVVLVFRDQTGTRTTQRKLAESEQRYRALADSGQGLIWTCDANRQFDYFNRPWLQFTGRTLAEECGTGWLEAVHPEDRDRCWAIYCQAFEQRETFSMVYRLRRRDGAYRRVQNDGTPQYGAEGEFLGYIGHCLDITEHLEMREWYGTLFREMTGGLAMHRVDPSANGTSRHYRFMAVNPAFERLTGLRTAELLGQRLATVLPGLAERWTEVYDRVARTGAPVELEHFGPIMGHHFRLTAYQPSPGHFATILMDITERVQVAAERQRNQQRLSCLAEVLQHPCNSVKEFLDFALEQALRLTGSAIGYIYHYSEERQELVLNSWSKSVMASCGIENPKYCRELSTTGLWGETVRQRKPIIVNDYAAPNRLKHGYPEGHAELRNYLTVPVIIEGRIVGVVAVANKATDYRREDVRQLRLLFDAVWKEVGRKEAEESLRASERQYRLLFERAPVGIFKIDSTGEGLQFNPALAGMPGRGHPGAVQFRGLAGPALADGAGGNPGGLRAGGENHRWPPDLGEHQYQSR
jgi:PAS domain S-box-containing protein